MGTLVRLLLLALLVIVIPFHTACVKERPPVTPVAEIVVDPVPPAPVEPVQPAQPKQKVVLITLDGTRWQEMFYGTDKYLYHGKKLTARELLPNLYNHFVDKGMVVGRDSKFIATGPIHISLPGYLEIMRGHPSTDCQSNTCVKPLLKETIADQFDNSAVFASWDTIKLTVSDNPDRFVINCGRSYRSPAWLKSGVEENNTFPEFFDPEYRPDSATWMAAMLYLRDHDPDFLWISFGDTDEWAHAGNYEEYIKTLQELDRYIGALIYVLEQRPGFESYTFIVTADHGRNLFWHDHGPEKESERDWLMMFGKGVPEKGFVKYNGIKSLSNILPTVKHLVSGETNKDSLL